MAVTMTADGSAFNDTTTGPTAGDARTSAGVRNMVQPVLNSTKWLKLNGRLRKHGFSECSASTTSSTYVDVTGGTITLSDCVAGEIIEFEATYTQFASSGVVDARLEIVNGATTKTGTSYGQVFQVGTTPQLLTMRMVFTVVNAGSVVCHLEHKGAGANTSTVAATIVARRFGPGE